MNDFLTLIASAWDVQRIESIAACAILLALICGLAFWMAYLEQIATED